MKTSLGFGFKAAVTEKTRLDMERLMLSNLGYNIATVTENTAMHLVDMATQDVVRDAILASIGDVESITEQATWEAL